MLKDVAKNNRNKLYNIALKNTKRNEDGLTVVEKGDTWRDENMEAVIKKPTRRSFKNKKNVIKPKVENGKVILDRNNPLHIYIFNDDDNIFDEIQDSIADLQDNVKKMIEINNENIELCEQMLLYLNKK